MAEALHWYAARVYWHRQERVKKYLETLGIEYYAQKIMPSILFIRTTQRTVILLRQSEWESFMVYSDRSEQGGRLPLVVPDKELEIFRIVTSAGDTGLRYLGDDPSKYQKGDKVRVTEGPFKGAEGYIARIKKDRRLVVTISGVAAVATSYIPFKFLEKV